MGCCLSHMPSLDGDPSLQGDYHSDPFPAANSPTPWYHRQPTPIPPPCSPVTGVVYPGQANKASSVPPIALCFVCSNILQQSSLIEKLLCYPTVPNNPLYLSKCQWTSGPFKFLKHIANLITAACTYFGKCFTTVFEIPSREVINERKNAALPVLNILVNLSTS